MFIFFRAIISCKVESQPSINNTSDTRGSINVYFNKSALTEYATHGNKVNFNINLENRLLKRINEAAMTIDLATYEINLEKIIDVLIETANQGLGILIIVDAKNPNNPHSQERYTLMRLYLEKMARGTDQTIGTDNDIILFSDSLIFAVEG